MEYKVKYGKWMVATDNSLVGAIYSGKDTYTIAADRLTEPEWIAHFTQKSKFFDLEDFIKAYLYALKEAGIKELTIEIF